MNRLFRAIKAGITSFRRDTEMRSTSTADLASQLQQESPFVDRAKVHNHWRKGEWVTGSGEIIHVSRMSDQHLARVDRLLYHQAGAAAQHAFSELVTGLSFLNGEAALDSLEFEIDRFETDDYIANWLHAHPFYPHLQKELEARIRKQWSA